jgi:hypothetical protein
MGLLAAAGGIREHVREAVQSLFGQNQLVVFGDVKPVGFSVVVKQNFLSILK